MPTCHAASLSHELRDVREPPIWTTWRTTRVSPLAARDWMFGALVTAYPVVLAEAGGKSLSGSYLNAFLA
jgi:hypothetical protein